MIAGHSSLADGGVCLSPPARLWTLSYPTTLPVTLNSSAHIVPLSWNIPRNTLELYLYIIWSVWLLTAGAGCCASIGGCGPRSTVA